MKIPPYCWQIKLPVRIEEISDASATDHATVPHHKQTLAITTVAEIGRRRRESPAYGLPTHIALSGEGHWIFLYPTPRASTDVSLTELASFYGRPAREARP